MRRSSRETLPQGSSAWPGFVVRKIGAPAAIAASTSVTPPIRNQSHGCTRSSSNAQPAEASTWPSPVASITTSAVIACRPARDSNATPTTRRPSTSARAPQTWNSTSTPASVASAFSASRMISGS